MDCQNNTKIQLLKKRLCIITTSNIMTNKRQATIKDIAKRLGLSASTVSRALKDHPDISLETKDAVKKTAEELDYQPNALALGLHNQKSNIIGVIIPQIIHYFFSAVISGIEREARKKGYNVIICQSDESMEREIENIKALVSLRVDGFLICITKETKDYAHFQKLMSRNVPVVFFDRPPEGFACDRCIIDDYAAAYQAAEHLVKLGKKKIFHFAGPDNVRIGKDRRRGFVDCMKRNGIKVDENTVFKCDSKEEAKDLIDNLIKDKNIPDGIFCCNDTTAVATINALAKYNIKVPDQVAVEGFSNDLISQLYTPSLTTIDQNGGLVGEKAFGLLLKRIESQDFTSYQTVIVPTKLIVRESTIGDIE